MKNEGLNLAARVQSGIISLPFRVTLDGLTIGHFGSPRIARETSALYPGSIVVTG